MGHDKALVHIDGAPMAQRVAAALVAGGCDPVLLVGGDAPALDSFGLLLLEDRWPGQGPLGAIITVLGHTGVPTLVAACDLPWLDAATVRSLAELHEATDEWADVVLATTDRDELMCACWMPSALPELQRQFDSGQRAIRGSLGALRVLRRPVAAAALRNVNTPDDVPPL
jgi:molybdopterin-guanine dinucleotide biosynthesis protein A